jgi:heme/copper-type cytochrome/quinol oxidase subunit 1
MTMIIAVPTGAVFNWLFTLYGGCIASRCLLIGDQSA